MKTSIGEPLTSDMPQDWEVVPLASLCRVICDGTHFTPHYVSQGVPFYSVENVTANDFANTKFITEEEHAVLVKRCLPERGDILMTRIGSLGDTKLVDWDVRASIYVSLALLKLNERVTSGYLYRYTKSRAFVRDIEARALLNAAPKKINMGEIGAVPIPVPKSKLEQEAIAAALGDADALIEYLEQLVAKKRRIKQGAMQELLTGKRRLPGFSGGWEVRDFGELAAIRNVKIIASTVPAGTPCVELESIDQGTGRLLGSIDAKGTSSKYSFKKGDVLFGRLRAYLKKYWLATFDGICSTEIWPLIPRDDRTVGSFLHLLVQTSDFVDAACISYGTHMPRSDWSVLRKFSVQVPSRTEQEAITNVLSDMDIELAVLETKLAKARQIKDGMMQNLLTGRIRLV